MTARGSNRRYPTNLLHTRPGSLQIPEFAEISAKYGETRIGLVLTSKLKKAVVIIFIRLGRDMKNPILAGIFTNLLGYRLAWPRTAPVKPIFCRDLCKFVYHRSGNISIDENIEKICLFSKTSMYHLSETSGLSRIG